MGNGNPVYLTFAGRRELEGLKPLMGNGNPADVLQPLDAGGGLLSPHGEREASRIARTIGALNSS